MISFANVTKAYGDQPILSDLSLVIERGSFVALVGASGAGKTTLLKTVNRLVEIDDGTILVDGQDIATRPVSSLRRSIGYVFQGIGLFPHFTVAENIWIAPRLQGAPPAEREDRVAQLLDLVSLPRELADRLPKQLSGGQAQRVGFARALTAGPAIMLMDEPFGALDPVTRSELGRAYRAVHEKMGLTSLMVTHDLAEALLLADRVIVLGGGSVLADLPPGDLLHFNGEPGVQAMLETVRSQADRLEALARLD